MSFPKEINSIIRSFLFSSHEEAIDFQRKFRMSLYSQQKNDYFKYLFADDIVGGDIYIVDCAMCEEIMEILLLFRTIGNRTFKRAMQPYGCYIPVLLAEERSEIVNTDIILPCCDSCMARWNI